MSGRSRFPLAGECPLCGAERLEDGAPAPRDRLLRKGLVLLVLAHTEKALRDTGGPFLCLYRSRRVFAQVEFIRRLADDARGTVLYSRLADDARGGVPPLQRLGALRGRSPRFACPVRPLGRLSLGEGYKGVGRWVPSPVSSPDSGVGVYEVGGWLVFLVSSPGSGVPYCWLVLPAHLSHT